jgi:hypothetical protein
MSGLAGRNGISQKPCSLCVIDPQNHVELSEEPNMCAPLEGFCSIIAIDDRVAVMITSICFGGKTR